MKKIIIAVIAFLPLASYAQDPAYIKNNQLCIKGVCVGDEITSLKSIKFEPARQDFGGSYLFSKIKVSPSETNAFLKRFMSSATKTVSPEIIKSWSHRKFDNSSIELLSKEKGFCKPIGELKGEYKTESGLPTEITIGIKVENNYSAQVWRVVGIEQTFSPSSYEELSKLMDVFGSRYGYGNPTLGTTKAWEFSSNRLRLSEVNVSDKVARNMSNLGNESLESKLSKYPGCAKEMTLD